MSTTQAAQFIGEKIECAGGFDVSAMARGEPGVPSAVIWRGQRFDIARVISSARRMGEDRGDRYVRRHYYDVETTDALRLSLYFERNPSSRGHVKAWWLHTLTVPEPVIDTERLTLRRWTYADRDAFRLMLADPDVMRHLHALAPMSSTEADQALIATVRRYAGGFGDWAIVERSSGDIAGESGLTAVDDFGDERFDGQGHVEIGWLLRPAFWGKGYGFEAASAVKTFAFETLGLPTLWAFVRPDNERSRRLAQRLGMSSAKLITTRRGQEMAVYELSRPQS